VNVPSIAAITSVDTRAEPAVAFSRGRDLRAGARAMTPWLVGIVPFGLVVGVTAERADIPLLAGWLTGPLLFGGSAQIAVIGLLDVGASPIVVICTALAINLRLVLYSAAIATHWRGMPRWWQALAASVLVDASVVVGVNGYERTTDRRRAHLQYVGAAALLWTAWLAAMAIGATIGGRLPAALHLELVIPLFLAGEVAARLTTRAARHAAVVAAVAAVLTMAAPLRLGPMLAICAGIVAGLRAQRSEPGDP
jgi:predicted branched-subunit amino acid permease